MSQLASSVSYYNLGNVLHTKDPDSQEDYPADAMMPKIKLYKLDRKYLS